MKRRDNLSEEAILSLLKTHGRCSARDVAQALGSTRMAAFLMMTAMERYGKLEYDPRLGYAIAPKSATVLTMALAPGRVEARLYDLGGRQLKAATQAVEDGS